MFDRVKKILVEDLNVEELLEIAELYCDDNTYELSDEAQAKGTLLDKKDFVRGYLDSHFRRISSPPYKVYQVAEKFKNNIVLCTMRGHIVCIKYGIIYDTFNPSDRVVEDVWLVK